MIPVYMPSLDGNEKKYVNECLDSNWISSKGKFVAEFEQKFAEFIGSENATTVTNGTVALHLALEALGIGEGDEVIVPSLTYIASVNTILQTGATVQYADSDDASWNVDVESITAKITSKTKAVMVVHLYGLSCDMDPIVELCRKHGLLLIEDCAEAFGSYYKGQHVGTFGDVATFSFFGNKTITTGEGGMVICKQRNVHEKACHLKSQGVSKDREYWHDVLAYNYRMTNITAAIGVAQLERAKDILQRKSEIASLYKENLAGLPLGFQIEADNYINSYWMCSILLDNEEDRAPLREFLQAEGIETRPLFPPAHTMPHCHEKITYPVAEFLSVRGINLPSYPALTNEQVCFISEKIKIFFNK